MQIVFECKNDAEIVLIKSRFRKNLFYYFLRIRHFFSQQKKIMEVQMNDVQPLLNHEQVILQVLMNDPSQFKVSICICS